jgi:hypothetical protein
LCLLILPLRSATARRPWETVIFDISASKVLDD